MKALIRAEDLHYRYADGTVALKGISFDIQAGVRAAILGPNGAGKSTLLLHLNGLYLPQQGRVEVLGREVEPRNQRELRARVGLVFQDPDEQVLCSTVREDVGFGPVNLGLDKAEVQRRVQEALRMVGLEAVADKAPHRLSYGQKKRAAIAGVLAMRPEVILLDEPTAFLDPGAQRMVLQVLENLNRKGVTILIATHDVDLVAEWAQQVIIIKEGEVLASGDTALLFEEELLWEADLRLPIVGRIFNMAGMDARKVPRTVVEAAGVVGDLLTRG